MDVRKANVMPIVKFKGFKFMLDTCIIHEFMLTKGQSKRKISRQLQTDEFFEIGYRDVKLLSEKWRKSSVCVAWQAKQINFIRLVQLKINVWTTQPIIFC